MLCDVVRVVVVVSCCAVLLWSWLWLWLWPGRLGGARPAAVHEYSCSWCSVSGCCLRSDGIGFCLLLCFRAQRHAWIADSRSCDSLRCLLVLLDIISTFPCIQQSLVRCCVLLRSTRNSFFFSFLSHFLCSRVHRNAWFAVDRRVASVPEGFWTNFHTFPTRRQTSDPEVHSVPQCAQ